MHYSLANEILILGVTIATPLLIVFACGALLRLTRRELSAWRRLFGTTSIMLTLSLWIFLFWLPLSEHLGIRTNFFNEKWFAAIVFLAITGTALSLLLKGKARIYGLAASLFVLAQWTLSIVH